MTRIRRFHKFVTMCAVLGGLSLAVAVVRAQQAAPPAAGGAAQSPAGPLAPEKYKNIQVLKNVPADQLVMAMRFVAAATGQRCIDCHVQEADGTFAFDKDDKREKGTARDMMKIMMTVNDQFFNGRVQVTCATCHRGGQPSAVPPFAEMLTPQQVAAMAAMDEARGRGQGPGGPPERGGRGGRGGRGSLPEPDAVIAKYIDALGGQAAVDKLQTLVLAGTMTNRAGQKSSFTIDEKAPNGYRETIQGQPATTVGFDGTTGWRQSGTNTRDLSDFALQQATRMAGVGLATSFKAHYQNLRGARSRPIDGKAVVAISGVTAPDVTEILSFDETSGLLVRRTIMTRTPLGNLPEQIDYSDYRDVGGAKIPFLITLSTWDVLDTYQVVNVKPNAQVLDTEFAKPK